MGRPPKLADESFLPGLSSGEIGEMYKVEKDGRDMQKILVAYHYKSGKSIKEAAEATCTDPETTRRWITGMLKRGEAAIRHGKAPGPARILTRDEYARLVRDVRRGPRACGFKVDTWSYALVHKHAVKKFGVKIGYGAIVDNMHKLGVEIKPQGDSQARRASTKGRAKSRRTTRKKAVVAEKEYVLRCY